MPSIPAGSHCTRIRPLAEVSGRSICVMSPVTTACVPSPMTREEHLHLRERRVLPLVEDDEGPIERAPPHVGQGSHLDRPVRHQTGHPRRAQTVGEGVVERPQVRIDLVLQIAREGSPAARPPPPPAARGRSGRSRGASGPGRPMATARKVLPVPAGPIAEDDVGVLSDRVQVGGLARRPRRGRCSTAGADSSTRVRSSSSTSRAALVGRRIARGAGSTGRPLRAHATIRRTTRVPIRSISSAGPPGVELVAADHQLPRNASSSRRRSLSWDPTSPGARSPRGRYSGVTHRGSESAGRPAEPAGSSTIPGGDLGPVECSQASPR